MSLNEARAIGNIHIYFDLIALTVLIHFTGGIENPFIFLFVLHAIAAGIVFPYLAAYTVTTVAFLMVAALVGLEYAGIIPHVNLEGFVSIPVQPSKPRSGCSDGAGKATLANCCQPFLILDHNRRIRAGFRNR